MDSKRVAILAGVIGVLSAVVKTVPGILLDGSFEGGPPSWLPMFGTVGQSTILYIYGIDTVGALLMVALAVGFGYYASRQLDLRYEYRQFCGAVVAGTTIPLIVAWVVVAGAFVLGSFGGFSVLATTAMVLRLFATISLPVAVGVFAGAALTHFSKNGYRPPESDGANTDVTSTTS
ncbi:hypothetical protein [Halococcus agarilyticus]|uniref:hypothetical protein n=1 Tax=Halococcus agarilyticus TaxID=1232219 RepID=UPI000677E1D0|nr:hypothetical protein [Halococcus agarilyticus]